MNETLLFLLLAAVCVLIGAFVGNLFARLKQKTETGKLEERLAQAQYQEERLEERLAHIVTEREALRKEKELLNSELFAEIPSLITWNKRIESRRQK